MSEPEPKSDPAAPAIKELTGRIGKYDITKPLGKGAMGMVYLAHDTVLERDVALKVMVSQIADDPELNDRFKREAKAVARMSHPNVVNVFDLGYHTDGSPYIAMELLKGQDLQKAIRSGPMPVDRKVNYIIQVLAGLAHAHQAGIVHRDIKPANIFINHDSTVKIMDFGVARLTTASMTGTGNIVGTADYMSPEQVKGAKVDGRSDLFSVGCMLYELLAGRRPFHSDNLMAIFYKITHEEANFDLIPEGAEYDALMPILKKALAKSLDDRYQTAYEFATELREYLKAQTSAGLVDAHALEGLVDMEPPPTAGAAADASTLVGGDEHGGTVDLGSGRNRARPGTNPGGSATTVLGGGATVVPGTAAGAATVVPGPGDRPGTSPGARTQLRAATAPTVVRPTPAARPRYEPPPQHGSPVLYVAVGSLLVIVLGLGGFIWWRDQEAQRRAAERASISLPPMTAPPATVAVTTLPPPPTTAPPPTFAEAVGKAATQLRAAQAAFRKGDYDGAIRQAQAALSEDPGNAEAKRMAEQALKGQAAMQHFRAAENAIRQSDWAAAEREANAGRDQAPWDARGTDLIGRIQQAQRDASNKAQAAQAAQLTAQVNGLLGNADKAMADQKYDAAIALYDNVLALDATNQRALLGKTSAVGARAVAQAAAAGGGSRPGGHSFTVSKTVAQSIETKSAAGPEGFDDTSGVVVKRGSQAADLPGKIDFDIEPDQVKPGDKYTVKVYLRNEGNAPIQLKEMLVTTKINGRGNTGPVPPLVKDVAPQQKAMLLQLPDFWKEDTTSWSMEIVVRTIRGEKYTNQVSWK